MFNEIFQFELRFRFRQISTYIYFSVMFLLAFLSITTDVVSLGGATGKALINSPLQISQAAVILTAFGMFITAAIMGTPVYRDFKEGIYPLFFTTAMDKRSYLAGRFVGSFVVTVFAFSGILVGFWIGTLMPWMDAEKLAAFNFASYSEAFFNIILPNVFFSGAFFFAAYAITRNALSIYLSGIALFSVYFAALTLTRDYTNDTLAAMLDPFTFRTLSVVTKYWTIAERNVLHTTLSGLLLYNRLAWLAGGLVLLGLAFSVFKLSVPRQAASKIVESEAEEPSAAQPETLVVTRDFGATAQAKQFFQIAGLEFRSIVRAWSFIALSLLGIVNVLLNATQLGKTFGTTTYPVTYLVLDLVGNSFSLFVIIIITVYAGELVWRERELNLDLVFDALPIPNWVMSLSKLTALVLVQALLLVLLMVTGILLQLSKGYTNIEFGLYLKDFALNFIGYIQVCTLAILVHTLVNQKYIGHGVMILYYIALIAAVPLGFEHLLYQIFGNIPYTYSDMNGYGHFVSRIVWFNVYFTVIAVFFAVLTNLFWVRGAETTFSKRWYLFKQRFTGGAKASFVAALVGILGTGGFIFYNTNVVNT
jgi:ABC-2 type transport system permease protein